jgi:hypothetical protein
MHVALELEVAVMGLTVLTECGRIRGGLRGRGEEFFASCFCLPFSPLERKKERKKERRKESKQERKKQNPSEICALPLSLLAIYGTQEKLVGHCTFSHTQTAQKSPHTQLHEQLQQQTKICILLNRLK